MNMASVKASGQWALEEENSKLERLLADAMLDNAALKNVLSKNCNARYQTRSGGASYSRKLILKAAGGWFGRIFDL
jgi:hypothetical protein